MIFLGYLCAVLVGFALGLQGGGGSILTVPIFVYLFRIPASVATMYSLFIVGITSLVGTVGYLRLKLVDFRHGSFFLIPSLVGVWVAHQVVLGAQASKKISSIQLKRAFGTMVFGIAALMIFKELFFQ